MTIIVCVFALLLAFPASLLAAEIAALKAGQSGDKGFVTFDLVGNSGEREAEVTVSLTISGRNYAADKLTLKGDFGKKVKTGTGKRIEWDLLADIPAGFAGEVSWNVDAAGTAIPVKAKESLQSGYHDTLIDSPFEFSELAARDKNTGLLWLRELSREGNDANFSKASGAVSRLAAKRYAGCSDWKLPLADELTKIVNYAVEAGYTGKKGKGYPADYFNTLGFKGVANDYYWSAFPGIGTGPVYAFKMAVDLEDGIPTERQVKDYLQFWPVCTPE